jgi:hypothetical protein
LKLTMTTEADKVETVYRTAVALTQSKIAPARG